MLRLLRHICITAFTSHWMKWLIFIIKAAEPALGLDVPNQTLPFDSLGLTMDEQKGYCGLYAYLDGYHAYHAYSAKGCQPLPIYRVKLAGVIKTGR